LYKEWDWTGAEAAFRRALELNPTLADARAHYAWYFDLLGPRDRALEEMRRAIESDPLDPLWPAWLASLYLDRGRHAEAQAAARQALEVNPGFGLGTAMLGLAFAGAGLLDSALALLEPLAARDAMSWGALGGVYVQAGRRGDARQLAARMEESGPRAARLAQLPILPRSARSSGHSTGWSARSRYRTRMPRGWSRATSTRRGSGRWARSAANRASKRCSRAWTCRTPRRADARAAPALGPAEHQHRVHPTRPERVGQGTSGAGTSSPLAWCRSAHAGSGSGRRGEPRLVRSLSALNRPSPTAPARQRVVGQP
jgi:tetratricopeptide (TPR) repeat protein